MSTPTPPINDSRSRGARRAYAEELASLLGTPDGLRTARLLGMGASSNVEASGGSDLPGPSSPQPISIWQPRQDDGELVFVRPAPLLLGDHYAAQTTIRAKKDEGARVVFLGESVAAGYLYAPHLTPAGVLEAQLRSLDSSFEVVDLARTNETLHGLVTTARAARQLEPDLLVIFAGNNWNLLETPEISPYIPSVEARQRYAQALVDGGVSGPQKLAQRELQVKIKSAFENLAADLAGVPVVLVVPEVNLADWESRQPVPWLVGDTTGDATAEWYRLYEGALGSLEEGRWSTATALAGKMTELDGGTVGTPFRILARAHMGCGRDRDAREACRLEVDRTSYATLAFLDAPRATTQAQDALRQAAIRHDWMLVDLPKAFAEETSLPGRRFFLDYCHLTSEGIRLAMAEVAVAVAGRLGGRDADRHRLRRVEVGLSATVEAQVEATACFGAAVHGAHRLLTVGGDRTILEYWCHRALEVSPSIADTMLDLISARCSPTPAVLSAAQQRNLDSPHRLLLQHGWRWDFVDAELVATIVNVLEETGLGSVGRPVREEVDSLLADRLAVGGSFKKGVELAAAPFLWEPLERFYPEVMDFADVPQWGVLRAPCPQSSFCLVTDGRDIQLDLTARLPSIAGFDGARTGDVDVRVNGTSVGRVTLGEKWTRRRLEVKANGLGKGMHRVSLVWPTLPPAGDQALGAAIRSLELGREADIHPVFGEVGSMRATGT